jgi:hypothetical protein
MSFTLRLTEKLPRSMAFVAVVGLEGFAGVAGVDWAAAMPAVVTVAIKARAPASVRDRVSAFMRILLVARVTMTGRLELAWALACLKTANWGINGVAFPLNE